MQLRNPNSGSGYLTSIMKVNLQRLRSTTDDADKARHFAFRPRTMNGKDGSILRQNYLAISKVKEGT